MIFRNSNDNAPCKGCVNRTAECHATCAKYTDYQQKKFAEYEMRAKTANQVQSSAEYHFQTSKRMKRTRKKVGE